MPRLHNVKKSKTILPGVTLYKTKDGHWTTRKTGIDGDRIKKDPAYFRARQNAAEFGHAGKAGKLIRYALRDYIDKLNKVGLTGRLLKVILQSAKADKINTHGKRTLITGAPEMLEGFQFNHKQPLTKVMAMPYTIKLNPDKSKVTVQFHSYIPVDVIWPQLNITHYKLVAACGYINMENETYGVNAQRTAFLPLNNRKIDLIELTNKITDDKGNLNFLAVGIEFFEEVNGKFYPPGGSASGSLAIIKVFTDLPNSKLQTPNTKL